MFRLFFLMALAIFLVGCFGSYKNNSSKQANRSAAKAKSCQVIPHAACCKDGKDGKDGQNGKDGRDGRDGRAGIGIKGEKGSRGVKGSQGEKGQQGQRGLPGTCDAKSSSSSKSMGCSSGDCSNGFHFFEKVQDLPTRGAVDVQHFTIEGHLFLAFANFLSDIKRQKTSSMIYKLDESTGKFYLYQTLQTIGAHGLEYFSIANKHFLAVAYRGDGLTPLWDSTIYKWNGKLFVGFQKIPTKAGSDFTYFNKNEEHYLAVANLHDRKTFSIKSVIYKWRNGKLNRFQDIPTEGALRCTAFVINNDTFLAFANYYNFQLNNSVKSTVFKWSGGQFSKVQSLQTYGAFDAKSFNINGHTFLAFANHHDSGRKYNIDSFIYKWNGSKFVLFQSIPTRGATAWHPFLISGQTYLGVANYYDDSQKQSTKSVVYQASGARFINYQEIPTVGGHDMTSFEYKGHTYLAVVNHSNGQKFNINSALYKWV